MPDWTCAVPGCRRPVRSFGLCRSHLVEWDEAGRPVEWHLPNRRVPVHPRHGLVLMDEPLTCDCRKPRQGPLGECGRCRRVIASLMRPGCLHRWDGTPGHVCGRTRVPGADRCEAHVDPAESLPEGLVSAAVMP